MTRYLISFPRNAMDHIPEEEMGAVAQAAGAVVREAKSAGVFVFAGGIHEELDLVAPDGTVTGSAPHEVFVGGLTIVDVPSREEALRWAGKIAAACRCPQEVREVGHDPEVGN